MTPARELLIPDPADASRDLPALFEEFSRVTAELAQSHDTLLEQVASLRRELDDKNRELERKRRLEALGRVAAGVAHEFRNPLGGIRLTVDNLLAASADPEVEGRLRHVQRAVAHLDRIVDELLDFTRAPRIERHPLNLLELVTDALELAFPDLDEVRPRFEAGGSEHLCVSGDRSLVQVLVNLLQNAEQATAENEAGFGVWWGRRDDSVWIEVADDGPGIPDGEDERIFHPFHSLKDAGTGLGLAIVHSHVENHGGAVAVVLDAWGGRPDFAGARFRVTLPYETKEQR